MAVFDFDTWWLEHVGPEDNVMDIVYKKITKDAIEDALKFYGMDVKVAEERENESIDMDEIDMSDVL